MIARREGREGEGNLAPGLGREGEQVVEGAREAGECWEGGRVGERGRVCETLDNMEHVVLLHLPNLPCCCWPDFKE